MRKYNIKNEIVEFIIEKTDNKNIKNRNQWIRDNYKTINSCIEILKKN